MIITKTKCKKHGEYRYFFRQEDEQLVFDISMLGRVPLAKAMGVQYQALTGVLIGRDALLASFAIKLQQALAAKAPNVERALLKAMQTATLEQTPTPSPNFKLPRVDHKGKMTRLLNDETVRRIRNDRAAGMKLVEIERKYGLSITGAHKIVTRQSYKNVY